MYKEIFRCCIIPFQSGLDLTVGLKVGSPLQLQWERSNKLYPKAIRVEYHGQKIGYIPSVFFEKELHEYHARGHKIWCYVTEDYRKNPTMHPITVGCKIKLNNPSEAKEELDVEL